MSDEDREYPNNVDIGGFVCTVCIFISSITVSLFLDISHNIEGIVWALPIVSVSSVVGLFALDKRQRRLEIERKKALKKCNLHRR